MGITGSYYFSTQVKVYSNETFIAKKRVHEDVFPINLGVLISVGYGWEYGKSLMGFIQLNLGQQISSIKKDKIKEKFTSIGLGLGFRTLLEY